jgi:hypothetical protein
VDGNPVPTVFSGFRVLRYLRELVPTRVDIDEAKFGGDRDALEAAWEEASDGALLTELATVTGLTRDGLVTILKVMSMTQGRFFAELQVDGNAIRCRPPSREQYLPFRVLASSEQQFVMVDIFLRLAEYCARFAPTILVLGHRAFPSLDDTNLPLLLNKLGELDLGFQLIATIHRFPKEISPGVWSTWKLDGHPSGRSPVTITELESGSASWGLISTRDLFLYLN